MRNSAILFIPVITLLAWFNPPERKRVTLFVTDESLPKVLNKIEKQTGYTFAYSGNILKNTKNVSINVSNMEMEKALDLCLKDEGISFSIDDEAQVIKLKKSNKVNLNHKLIDVAGTVKNKDGVSLRAVSVIAPGKNPIFTDTSGGFYVSKVLEKSKLTFLVDGYDVQTITVTGEGPINIKLEPSAKLLEETVVQAYSTTSQRLKTGSITAVKGEDLQKQPVTNPLAALEGRVPGLTITQSNGLPGSFYQVKLRGQSSIGPSPGSLQPGDPLFVIDGVPFAPNNNSLQVVASGTSLGAAGRSPFSCFNMYDIERIDVLKDADATAIYGSRGANGVILITTKKGVKTEKGKPRVELNMYTGVSTPVKKLRMLNNEQYISLRREAVKNDGVSIQPSDTADLADPSFNTDYQKMLIGNKSHITDVQTAVSGGTDNTKYYLGAGYHRESTVFPGAPGDRRGSVHGRLDHQTRDRRFSVSGSASYCTDNNQLLTTDLTNAITLPPNASLFYGVDSLNWQLGQFPFQNPLATLRQTFVAKTENALVNTTVSYKILPELTLKTHLGYSTVTTDETSILPRRSLNPLATTGSSYFGRNEFKSWIAEPHAEYVTWLFNGKLTTQLGATWQQLRNNVTSITATGYTNDDSLNNTNAARDVNSESFNSLYKYQGFFARISYNYLNKYLLNINGRYDGSSRFGPKMHFGTFGAAGAGWVLSEEKFIKKALPYVSFAKLRASYGVTGNDQVGDYKFLKRWILLPDNGGEALPSFSWEITRKIDAAMDLGLFDNRLFLTIDYYRNRTSRQILSYKLPGFSNLVAMNSGAVVQNSGFEITLQGSSGQTRNFRWNSEFSITIPHNKLLSFPELEKSRYANFLVVGKSLTFQRGYRYSGLDAVTGLFTFVDKDQNGLDKNDYVDIGHLDPRYYGGLKNSFAYKNWNLDIFIEYRKQLGYSLPYAVYNAAPPGTLMVNQPVAVLDRWQKPGDQTAFQRLHVSKPEALTAIHNLWASDGGFANASYLRLKNVYLRYTMPEKWLMKVLVKSACVFVQAQNVITITPYQLPDPGTQSLFTLPPMKTIAVGIHCGF